MFISGFYPSSVVIIRKMNVFRSSDEMVCRQQVSRRLSVLFPEDGNRSITRNVFF